MKYRVLMSGPGRAAVEQSVFTQFIDRIPAAFREGDPAVEAKPDESDNVRRLQELYRLISKGDYAAFRGALSEEIDLEIMGPAGNPFVGYWKGRDEVMAAVTRNFGMLDQQNPELETLVAQGDSVVVLFRERGLYRETGAPYQLRCVQWFRFLDGKIRSIREMADNLPGA